MMLQTTSRFNPRVREGRDFVSAGEDRFSPVSIHASVKDATPPVPIIAISSVFQSTRP